jgi:hypothetical protein
MATNIQLPSHLGATGYVRILQRIGDGQLAFTFLAHVLYRGSLRRAYLKFYDASSQPAALLNEVLGYVFAQAMDIPCPPVFFVDVPGSELARYGLNGAPASVSAVGTLEAHDPASASEGTAKTLYNAGAVDLPQIRERLLKAPAGRALLAFDEAVGNPDRNIGNIVFSRQGVVAIDHGCILGGPTWTSNSLNSTEYCRNKVFEILNQTPLTDNEKNSLQAAAEVMLEAYYDAIIPLGGALAHRQNANTCAAFDYVWWRALHLKRRMGSMLGLVT